MFPAPQHQAVVNPAYEVLLGVSAHKLWLDSPHAPGVSGVTSCRCSIRPSADSNMLSRALAPANFPCTPGVTTAISEHHPAHTTALLIIQQQALPATQVLRSQARAACTGSSWAGKPSAWAFCASPLAQGRGQLAELLHGQADSINSIQSMQGCNARVELTR